MTEQQHPITPPPELVQQWIQSWHDSGVRGVGVVQHVAPLAARWGADQELEACLQLLDINGCPSKWIDMLRAARRPKPPSLAEQAIAALDQADKGLSESEWQQRSDTIRAALKRLQELEGKQ